ncbi:MAG TPA: alpha/beta fold hydrolase [Actinomycetota bacterium]|nr:alpha/beta fold hydrolase [Actinomycetota bacterium]
MGETLFARLPGATVAYELGGGGERLVWCHGLGSCRAGDRDVIDTLSEHFTVLSYDARGHGESPPVVDEAAYNYASLSADLRALLDYVSWPRVILAGASMGAATSARVAMEEPARVSHLIIARPATSGGPASPQMQLLFRLGGEAIRSGGWEAAVAFLMTIPEAAEQLSRDPGRLESLRADWSRHDPASIAAALIGIPASGPLTPEVDITAIRSPTLVIPGNDLLHPTAAGETVASLIPGARLAPAFDGLPRAEEVRGLVRLIRDFVSGV